MKTIIAGMGKNNEIGAEHDMPWKKSQPADLARFSKMTTGKSVIMGRNTFEHDMHGKPLPNRQNIVVSRTPTGVKSVLTAVSLEAAYALAQYPIFVIGGGKLYADAIKDMDVLEITEIDAEFPEATVFFPNIDMNIWEETSRESYDADDKNVYAYSFVTYIKRDTI